LLFFQECATPPHIRVRHCSDSVLPGCTNNRSVEYPTPVLVLCTDVLDA